ncbi:hypothetical protein PIB30_096024 [Stylosanthes scabra]|uniref:Putative plant transposon protein domain-containing protein n=1 Tax=Stylosanthes scabra TaxID=79078 RepID=A0ABU6TYC4_9FABA|nr:hypothetical protein [Stylosanthes scabra]
MASSSSVSVFDNYRFQSAFNEELYNTIVKNKKVISERRLEAPKTEISKMLIHEFYANAIIIEEEREEHGGHSYKSFVRGVPVNFSPENIRRVMRFKDEVERARTDFVTRKAHDQQLDNVLADLCMPGATWKLSTGQQKVPIQLKRFYNQVREEQREMAKEIQQVKNYQVNQTMIKSARNKALMEELAAVKTRQEEFFSNQTNQYNLIRKEQNLLGKEILDVKKHQVNTITMGSSSSPNKYEPD